MSSDMFTHNSDWILNGQCMFINHHDWQSGLLLKLAESRNIKTFGFWRAGSVFVKVGIRHSRAHVIWWIVDVLLKLFKWQDISTVQQFFIAPCNLIEYNKQLYVETNIEKWIYRTQMAQICYTGHKLHLRPSCASNFCISTMIRFSFIPFLK